MLGRIFREILVRQQLPHSRTPSHLFLPIGAVRPCINNFLQLFASEKSIMSGEGELSSEAMPPFTPKEYGGLHHEDYRIFLFDNNGKDLISPFHDIPLFTDKKGFDAGSDASKGIFNIVVEIPRWTNAKMEINTKEPFNPIKQDVKKGKPRFVCNVFPHKGYIWNYGAFPQTWEDPNHITPETGFKGDGDPVDVCEIGHRVANRGEVLKVKVLGVIALIDEGETDWKVLAINTNDPLADKLNDVEDIEKYMPGFLANTIDWFRCYKVPDGKPENEFAFNGEARGKDLAIKVLEETHGYWKDLIKAHDTRGLSCKNTTVKGTPHCCEPSVAAQFLSRQPAYRKTEPVDPSVDKWHYVARK